MMACVFCVYILAYPQLYRRNFRACVIPIPVKTLVWFIVSRRLYGGATAYTCPTFRAAIKAAANARVFTAISITNADRISIGVHPRPSAAKKPAIHRDRLFRNATHTAFAHAQDGGAVEGDLCFGVGDFFIIQTDR